VSVSLGLNGKNYAVNLADFNLGKTGSGSS
jgi:hypothetical protein